ncbi:ABC transporter permease [Rhizobium sp. RU36D]|uniref:ABC transporter permease n=1 Tax=Rhizobium sp. RU36D TaxID=1907415 RepID=UPI0009D83D93|nr:ABC transporter permease [Rhizobium sp. RU36D]SMC80599.1 amino acid ABC transporter membrane protein 2, PAAT family [Rhizobium sp. RU36D]
MSIAQEMIPPRPAPPAVRPPLTRARVIGWITLGIWLLLVAQLLLMLVSNWDVEKFVRYGPRYWDGLLITVMLVSLSVVMGAILSLPVTFARMSKNPVLQTVSFAFVYTFRGTPLLAQLFLIYYGLGSFRSAFESVGLWWFFRDALYCSLLALTLNTAAYQAEILRGAIESVPRGQREGAASLGLSKTVTFFKIILPQALIVALRPYGNEIILLIKGSTVVSIVTVFDIMGQTRYTFSRTFDYQAYLWAAVFYLTIVEGMRQVLGAVEAGLTWHLKR